MARRRNAQQLVKDEPAGLRNPIMPRIISTDRDTGSDSRCLPKADRGPVQLRLTLGCKVG